MRAILKFKKAKEQKQRVVSKAVELTSINRSVETAALLESKVESEEHQLSLLETFSHLLKGNTGPGCLSLPFAFSQLQNVYWAPLLYILITTMCTYNMTLLLRCKQKILALKQPQLNETQKQQQQHMTFGDVGQFVLGDKGKKIIDFFLVLTQFGFCCVYFTFIATNIRVILPLQMQKMLSERKLIVIIFPFLLGLSWIRSLHRITPFSFLANIAVYMGIGIIFYFSISHLIYSTDSSQYSTLPSSPLTLSNLALFYGNSVYSFEAIGIVLPIEGTMDPELRSKFPYVLIVSMCIMSLVYSLLGEIPLISFIDISGGSMTAVLQQHYADSWLVAFSNVLLAFSTLFSFPIQFYPAIEVIEKKMPEMNTSDIPQSSAELRWCCGFVGSCISWIHPFFRSERERYRTLIRSLICILLMIIALAVPNVGLLISFVGSVGSSMLALILPPLMYLLIDVANLSWLSASIHILLCFIGVVSMIVGSYQAINSILQ